MVICLERDADLHIAQLMPLPLTVSCFSKVQIGFTFLVPAHPGSPGQRAVKRVCVYVYVSEFELAGCASDLCSFLVLELVSFWDRPAVYIFFSISNYVFSGRPVFK